MTNLNLQERILEIIVGRYASRADAVQDLCQLLHASKDPVYRRLRGDTILSPDEMALLARHYQISIDALVFDRSDNVVCSFNAFSRPVRDFSAYLDNYAADLEQMQRLPGLHFYYASANFLFGGAPLGISIPCGSAPFPSIW
jgi:hypothetical protein